MITEHTIETADFPKVYYRKAGVGPVIVLLHGFPESGTLWDGIYPQLADEYTVIMPDLPGVGGSVLGNNELSMANMAAALLAILQAEDAAKVVVLGHSMGGYVSLAFADAYQEYLAGLGLIHSTAAADNEEKIETRKKAIALIEKGGKEQFIKQMVPNLFSPAFKEQHPERLAAQVDSAMQLEGDSMIAFYNAMIKRPERTELLKRLEVPVLWVMGKDDTTIPPDGVLQQTSLSNVNFVELYDNCGHMSMLEQPQKLVEDIKEFAAYCYGQL